MVDGVSAVWPYAFYVFVIVLKLLTVELEVGWSSASQWMIIVMRVLTCWRISLNMNCYVLKGWNFRSLFCITYGVQ